MSEVSDSPPGAGSQPRQMLDDPGLSRQWVLRRLQKQLTSDLALDACLRGLVPRTEGEDGARLRQLSDSTRNRVETLETAIRHEGGTPYSSVGLARALSRLGGRVLGVLGSWSWRMPLRRLQEHSVAELDSLVGFVRDAPGIDPGLGERLAPLLPAAEADLRALRSDSTG